MKQIFEDNGSHYLVESEIKETINEPKTRIIVGKKDYPVQFGFFVVITILLMTMFCGLVGRAAEQSRENESVLGEDSMGTASTIEETRWNSEEYGREYHNGTSDIIHNTDYTVEDSDAEYFSTFEGNEEEEFVNESYPVDRNIGWNHDEIGWWYAYGTSKGEYYADCIVEIDGIEYNFDINGYVSSFNDCENIGWFNDGDGWRYFYGPEEWEYYEGCTIEVDGDDYEFDKDGYF